MNDRARDSSAEGEWDNIETSLDPADWEAYRVLAHRVVDDCIDYLKTVRERPVWKAVPAAVRAELSGAIPAQGQGAARAFADFTRLVLPYATGNVHPRFWGWVHGSRTVGGALAHLLMATMNSNVGGRDHGAVYVERQVIGWFRDLFEFPSTASGLLVSGTSMATLIGLAVARNEAMPVVRSEGVQDVRSFRVYASDQSHSSVAKAIELLGLGSNALTLVRSDETFRMDVGALRAVIDRDRLRGLRPLAVVATAGTVSTGAIDDLDAVADVCRDVGAWLHVDGAFGALAKLAPAMASAVNGAARADSLAFDFHKWLHVPYDSGCILIRSSEAHRRTFASHAGYLARAERGLAGGEPWFCDLGPELSRSFRALPVWLTIREHGIERLGEKVAENCAQARYLGSRVRQRADLQLCAPIALNVVCFRFLPASNDASDDSIDRLNEAIVADLQERGIAAPSTVSLRGRSAIRVAITNHRSTRADFELLVDRVVEIGRARTAGA